MTNNPNAALSVQYVRGVGPRRAELLGRMGIRTILDALYYLPFRYEERGQPRKVHELLPDLTATVAGRVISANIVRLRGRGALFEAVLNDGTGYLSLKWFNQPYLSRQITAGSDLSVSGRVRIGSGRVSRLEMDSPDFEVLAEGEAGLTDSPRVLPVYRVTEGISQKQFRRIMSALAAEFSASAVDPIPEAIRTRCSLPPLGESLRMLHLPGSDIALDVWNGGKSPYHSRMVFGELFAIEAGLALRKRNAGREAGIAFASEGTLLRAMGERLPFSLTAAQRRVIDEVLSDMRTPYPMHRLIQGDVGSGKTVVALAAMLEAVECGYQAVLMAPTELLAEQHYLTVHRLLDDLGVRALLLTGSRRRPAGPVRCSDAGVVIGTHALVQERVSFEKLGIAVIDEQHRFGVLQRATLRSKGVNPDVLVMTATPIPRSLAMTLYGDLDCSVIDELPPDRTPVSTRVVGPEDRDGVLRFIGEAIADGRQAYVVYPAVEEGETVSVKSASEGREAFARKFPDRTVGLLHGRMKPGEREQVMDAFRAGRVDILVSTTVIEVGVDVPNATVMVVVHAERFGLSQLHQLRGRVGRGSHAAACLLIAYPPVGEDASRRLAAMTRTNDGFAIAEEDLAIRGPGDLLGTQQSGMPGLRIADVVRDAELLEAARREAFGLVESDPDLAGAPSLKEELDVFWKGRIDVHRTG